MKSIVALLASILGAATFTDAAVVSLSGTFNATVYGRTGAGGGTPPLIWKGSGSWSLTYDSTLIPTTGNHTQSLSLGSFTVSPLIQSTSYTEINTLADASFVDGLLTSLVIGGEPGGATTVKRSDFSVTYDLGKGGSPKFVVGHSDNYRSAARVNGGTITSIPEPQSALLFAFCGMAGLARRRR